MQPDFRTNGLGQQLLCFRVLFVITVKRGSRRAKWDCRQCESGLLLNLTVWQRFTTAILAIRFGNPELWHVSRNQRFEYRTGSQIVLW